MERYCGKRRATDKIGVLGLSFEGDQVVVFARPLFGPLCYPDVGAAGRQVGTKARSRQRARIGRRVPAAVIRLSKSKGRVDPVLVL